MYSDYLRERSCIAVVPIPERKAAEKKKRICCFDIRSTALGALGYVSGKAERIRDIKICVPEISVHIPHIGFDVRALAPFVSRAAVSFAGAVCFYILFFAVLFSYYTPCYEFVVNGRSIGISEDKTAYAAAVFSTNSTLIDTFGDKAAITEPAQIKTKIVPRNAVTDDRTLQNNVAALSALMVNAEVLEVNGKATDVALRSKSELDEVLVSLAAEYAGGGTGEFIDEVGSARAYVPASKVYTPEAAAEYIGENTVLRFRSVAVAAHEKEIDYETEQIFDDSMYSDQTEVVQHGEKGIRTVTESVTAVNGAETERTVLSDEITKQPVTEVIKSGTKRRPTGIGSGSFLFPTQGIISSRFGNRWGKHHDGLDIANSEGTEIIAADEGAVTFAGVQNGYGNIVILDHKNGYQTRYGHCSAFNVKVGDIVEKGAVIAYMGNTGKSTGPHLHFEVRKNGIAQDPEKYVSQK